jgi:hypothetical protein
VSIFSRKQSDSGNGITKLSGKCLNTVVHHVPFSNIPPNIFSMFPAMQSTTIKRKPISQCHIAKSIKRKLCTNQIMAFREFPKPQNPFYFAPIIKVPALVTNNFMSFLI